MGVRLPATIRNGALWLRRFAATTPGAIGAVLVISVVLCVLSGLVSANQLSGKVARRDAVLERAEPLAFAAQSLYVALSAADASAAAAFLSGGIETPEVRGRYQQALADAAAALADATTGASDQDTRTIVARITADLPAYTGLVEAARANNRQGFPVGSAYLREASTLMQTSLLPNAEQLTTNRFASVRRDQHDIGALPLTGLALLLLLVIGGGVASMLLLRWTNRRVNLGLIVATAVTALVLLWSAAATLAASNALDTGASGASSRFEALAQARILAQQARTDETLQLITRGDITAGEQDFTEHSTALAARLNSVVAPDSAAAQALTNWRTGHRRQKDLYEAANFPAAVEQAIGSGPDNSASRFAELDNALRDNLVQVRQELRDDVDSAGAALRFSPSGSLLLMVFAAVAVSAGLWPRLEEFL
ncbi:hypothetical protein [Nocardia australiensis]|uniref:hypothetical protein n=1 Tax=Nocardia australiensis TaxID=2887191 RepID=UPI001D14CC01|nr:hypothetical protein [Nocardia australiensis]